MRYGARMKPRELVASAVVPGDAAALQCWRHDGAYSLWVGRTELMSSRVHESEELLAEVVVQALGSRPHGEPAGMHVPPSTGGGGGGGGSSTTKGGASPDRRAASVTEPPERTSSALK